MEKQIIFRRGDFQRFVLNLDLEEILAGGLGCEPKPLTQATYLDLKTAILSGGLVSDDLFKVNIDTLSESFVTALKKAEAIFDTNEARQAHLNAIAKKEMEW